MDLPPWAPVLMDPVDASLVLRGHRPEDVDGCLEQCRDPLTQRWTTVPVPYERMHAQEYVRTRPVEWAAGVQLSLAVELRGAFAGSVNLRPDPADGGASAELGFGLAPWARGQGLTERAVRILLAWAFDNLPLQTVHWHAIEGNWASRRVAWALGFTVHGPIPHLAAQRGSGSAGWLGTLGRDQSRGPRHPWFDVPVLTEASGLGDASLRLRAHRDQDAERVVAACADPLTQQWLPQLPSPYLVEHAVQHIAASRERAAAGRAVHWAVTARPLDDVLLAEVGLFVRDEGGGEIGYWVHPDARRSGVMRTAVRLVARYALTPAAAGGLGMRRLLIRVAAGNTASQRTALAAGFRPSGSDRNGEQLRDGTLMDMLRFDQLAGEYP